MVELLYPWLQQEGGKPHACFFNLIKGEYHVELIIYCICLYVGGGNVPNDSKMPKNRIFSYLVTPPTTGNPV